MPVVASITLPKVRINPGSRTFGPHAAPAVPLTGLFFTSLRNTSADHNRRGDTASSVYSILFEGQVAATGAWIGLGQAGGIEGGVYTVKAGTALRALRGDPVEMPADDIRSSFDPTLFSNLRATVTVAGGRFEGECTLELLGA